MSAECAAAMAVGARALLGSTYALATTGVAGPDRQEGHPAGHVWVAVAGPTGWSTRCCALAGDRATVQVRELSRRAVGARWHAPPGRSGPRVALALTSPTHRSYRKDKRMVLFRRLLGDVLRSERMQRGMTLREVSAEARVSLGYISEIERGQKEASSELLASLCMAHRPAALRGAARGLRRRRPRGACARPAPRRGDPDPGRLAPAPATWSPPPPDRSQLQAQARAGSAGTSRPPARGRARPAWRRGSACRSDGRASGRGGRPTSARAVAQVAGRGLDRPLRVDVEHLLGPAHQPGQVGHLADRAASGGRRW